MLSQSKTDMKINRLIGQLAIIAADDSLGRETINCINAAIDHLMGARKELETVIDAELVKFKQESNR